MLKKILFAEDKALADKIRPYLPNETVILQTDSIDNCMEHIKNGSYNLVVISSDTCGGWISNIIEIRQKSYVPIIITSKTENVIDKISALRIGADDYISFPIEPVAFSALAQAFIRRSTEYAVEFENKHELIQIRNMLIDLLANAVYIDGNEIKLTKTEYDILVFLARHKGQVLSREQIYEGVWNDKYVVDDRSIISHIYRLRAKIEDNPSEPEFILTSRGGYKFNPYEKGRT